MSKGECKGLGAGWGTVEGRTLRLLLLAGSERREEAEAWRRAIGGPHEVVMLASASRGPMAWLSVARAARSVSPHLVHALGLGGMAASAGSVAAGLGVPLVLSVAKRELEGRSLEKAVRWARRATAVLLASEQSADILRAAGVRRDLYVLSPPSSPEDDPFVLGAAEIVYGRVLAKMGLATGAEGHSFRLEHRPNEAPDLVQIGPGSARA